MKRRSVASVLVSIVLFLLPGGTFAQTKTGAAIPPGFAAKVDKYMRAQTDLRGFTGSILVARRGEVLFSKGYGYANLEWNIPNAPDTKFRLGSITKQFTAMAVMQLEQQGLLSVKDPVCKYLEPCPAAWKEVTIRHLLTHTSGIPSYTNLPDYAKKMMIPTSKEEMIARFRDLPLEFRPGEKYKYDNSGYFLLGAIIEKVTGRPYEEVVRSRIFDPLGMKNTGYDHSETILKKRAAGYVFRGDGFANAAFLDMAQPYAAGSLYSTVQDLLVWDQALYTEKLLPKPAMDAMFTPYLNNYAYGWEVRNASPGTFNRGQIAHGGGINGFSTYIIRYPEDRDTVIVLGNNQGFPAARVARDLSAILYGEKYETPAEHKAAQVDPSIYDAYVGDYRLAPEFVITITREGNRLMSQATGQPKFEIFPESEARYFLKVVDAQITFVKDGKGRVTQLVLHQNGRDMPAKKVR